MNWIFGYGSLMWRPGFAYRERRPALLQGYHRAFCRLSFRHRGTPAEPGMVVGLVPGGNCPGYVFLPEQGSASQVLAALDEREGPGYRRLVLPVQTGNGNGAGTVPAFAYVPVEGHPSHAPGLPPERQAHLIARGVGESGTARDYLRLLVETLQGMGVRDPELEAMADRVARLAASAAEHPPPSGR